MLRCRECNHSLKKEETECFTCGSRVQTETKQSIFSRRFAAAIKILFIMSMIMVPVSLFVDGLSFSRCFITMLVLHFVRSSAEQMLEKKKT